MNQPYIFTVGTGKNQKTFAFKASVEFVNTIVEEKHVQVPVAEIISDKKHKEILAALVNNGSPLIEEVTGKVEVVTVDPAKDELISSLKAELEAANLKIEELTSSASEVAVLTQELETANQTIEELKAELVKAQGSPSLNEPNA